MPYVNIKITREGATPKKKAALIRGVTQLLVDYAAGRPAPIEEFPVGAIKSFFTNIELKDAVIQAAKGNDPNGLTTVDFNITLSANYAI
jgi:hypothetical protein